MFKALVYAYILGGLTFLPLLVAGVIFLTIYTSVPVGDPDVTKRKKARMEAASLEEEDTKEGGEVAGDADADPPLELNDRPTTRKGWLTVRRTFEETEEETSYVNLVRSFLDARSKDPKRSRPKDMWYAVLKRNILYLYEDEDMSECDAAIELSGHDVLVYPEGLPDGELYAKRNAICLRPKPTSSPGLASVTKEMKTKAEDAKAEVEANSNLKEKEAEVMLEAGKKAEEARREALNPETPWFIFVRSNVEMEDWYFSLHHASVNPASTPTLLPLLDVFDPVDMNHLVKTLDDQPDVIPMRWLNALLGRIFLSHYRTKALEAYIIGRLMKKLEKVKRPQFLTDISVSEVSVGNRAPMLSKPMLKELTKEGDAALEVHFQYKGEIRLTIEATAVINLGARFKSYTVKLVLAAVLKELEGNLLIKVKRPPSNRIWYAFTQTPRMVLEVEPIVSDRQITWGMILSTMESKLKEIIQESIVMPNMDDIAFFDSLPFPENRGGIFADASRRHASQETADAPQADAAASAPALSPEPPSPPPVSVTAAQSDDALAVKVTASSSSTDSNSKASIDTNRRKTWFASVRSDGALSPDIFNDTRDSRGRTGSIGNKSELNASRSRSPLSHRRKDSVSSQFSNRTDQSSGAGSTPLRPSSRASNRSEAGQDATTNGSSPSILERRKSDLSQKNRSPSPPSFFSTLKSKAGDKQALSNSAKEAMRKWGVNWGLNKAASAGSSSDEGGSSSSNANLKPPTSPAPRASYAKVRAAVEERKAREGHSDAEGGESPPQSRPTTGTLRKAPSTKFTDSTQSGSTANVLSSPPRLGTSSIPRPSPKKSTPSISLAKADDASTNPSSAISEAPVAPATPIRAQPQAKMMTIPGIHAKKRGEVQAMGYVAPPQTSVSPSSSSTTSTLESKLKNPALQGISRFWKNQNATSGGGGSNNNDMTPDGLTLSSTGGERSTSATSSTPASRPETSGHASSASGGVAMAAASLSAEEAANGHAHPTASTPSMIPVAATTKVHETTSPASKALKDIVSRDESSRSATPSGGPDASSMLEEGMTGALNSRSSGTSSSAEGTPTPVAATTPARSPPPLPPRRVSLVA